MSRWIDADKLNIDFYAEYETADDEYVYRYVSEHQIDEAPSIEIVRCRECKYWNEGKCWNLKGLNKTDGIVNANDYCSYGEREGE